MGTKGDVTKVPCAHRTCYPRRYLILSTMAIHPSHLSSCPLPESFLQSERSLLLLAALAFFCLYVLTSYPLAVLLVCHKFRDFLLSFILFFFFLLERCWSHYNSHFNCRLGSGVAWMAWVSESQIRNTEPLLWATISKQPLECASFPVCCTTHQRTHRANDWRSQGASRIPIHVLLLWLWHQQRSCWITNEKLIFISENESVM